jgi:hypothetical protein
MVRAGVGVSRRASPAGPAMARHLWCVDSGEANTRGSAAERIPVNNFQKRAVDRFGGIHHRQVDGRHVRRNSDGSAPAQAREAEQGTDQYAHCDETDGGTEPVGSRPLVRGCFPRQTTVSRRMPTHDAPKVELIPHTLPITEACRRNKPFVAANSFARWLPPALQPSSNAPAFTCRAFASFSTTVMVGFRAPRSISLT